MSVRGSGSIRGHILVEGSLMLETPLIIGGGEDQKTERDLVRNGQGKPFIPGSSWAGAVRDHFQIISDKPSWMEFFGGDNKDSQEDFQSALVTWDLELVSGKYNVEFRENVAIDSKTGIAKEEHLFDYEILTPENVFCFGFEVTVREHNSVDDFRRYALTIIRELMEGRIQFGAKTGAGFGHVRLIRPRYRFFDFHDPNDVADWFTNNHKLPKLESIPDDVFEITTEELVITGVFQIEDSIMIRQNDTEGSADYRHLQSYRRDVIPGTSLRGVLRHHAERILNTVGVPNTEEMITNIFGTVDERKKIARKGRIKVKESTIKQGKRYYQTRIKIDHFTGGTVESDLFTTQPLGSDKVIVFNLEICLKKPQEEEIAVLLQVLKDLWSGRLLIGGEISIGRGRMWGTELVITAENGTLVIQRDADRVQIKDPNNLLTGWEAAWQQLLSKRISVQ